LLAFAGRVTSTQLETALLLVPAVALGAAVSRVAHRRIGGRLLRTFVLVFAIVSGVVLVVRA
jgi:uncharacterized membrane protein YfcA